MDADAPGMGRIILDSVAEAVFTVDQEWQIVFFNRAAEKLTGVPRRKAIGRRCCEVFQASICSTLCPLRHTLETGEAVANRSAFIIDARGRKLPVSVSTAVLRDEHGRLVGGVETIRDVSQVEELRKELEARYSLGDIIGRSQAMRDLFGVLPAVAASDSTVVIRGASGTGKELFARAIHNISPRRDKRFVAINCGALPDALLESELFGHKAGAFTDARQDRTGRFAHAEGGTLFLDEIGDISQAMQVRLLRVLQEQVYEPLGSVEPVTADVRVVAATHRDLDELVREGSFREDLFYRINVMRLDLPELRDRREDIPLLIEHFIGRFNRLQDKDVVGVADEVLEILMNHDYPGNARELENIIEHAFVLCHSSIIEVHHLPPELAKRDSRQPLPMLGAPTTLRAMEVTHITDALRRTEGNRKEAAELLGIHPSTLFRKIRNLKIVVPERDGRSRDNGRFRNGD
ncbi:MAG: sigma 54-interacting transcriptional regulator [Thermoanaerobaculales bacterium]|jgi:PAS domain S-box-containing protein|nr:sigma 54-interacting transcriptional regulator [Thermoanaerobaculales bacterium]